MPNSSSLSMRLPPNFTRTAVLLLLAAIPAFCLGDDRPNVVIILADDLGYGDLACYGHPTNRTPNLDRLAREGARLTNFNCPAPFCAPTRASLLTGRYPLRCGMTGNPAPDGGPAERKVALPATEILLPQLLHRAGYATGMIGKWHLGHECVKSYPTRRGFDEYYGILYSNDMRPVQLVDAERVVEYPLVQATLTRRYMERAVDFIERNRARPFFLYLAHAMPHKPLAVSEEFYKKSGHGLYADVIAELDWSVGRVLEKLRELQLDERTLVIFTSDNGPWFGGSTGGLRGMKSTSFEGGYRVPLIARWPGKIPAGHVNKSPAVTMDIFTTVLAASGVDSPDDRTIDGRNLMPQFRSDAKSGHDVIFGQQGGRIATVRDERYKLHVLQPNERRDPGRPNVQWIDPRGPDGVTILAPYEQSQPADYPGALPGDAAKAMMLFDLIEDPAEQRDIAATHPDVVERLKRTYDTFVANVHRSAVQ